MFYFILLTLANENHTKLLYEPCCKSANVVSSKTTGFTDTTSYPENSDTSNRSAPDRS